MDVLIKGVDGIYLSVLPPARNVRMYVCMNQRVPIAVDESGRAVSI